MDQYNEYFDNILSRSWLGQSREKTANSIEKSNITDLYLDTIDSDKVILLGKTEKFYFILECFDSEGYCYSNGLFNENLVDLISCYKNRNSITGGNEVEHFVSKLLLKSQLSKNLAEKIGTQTRIRKI